MIGGFEFAYLGREKSEGWCHSDYNLKLLDIDDLGSEQFFERCRN